MNMRPRRLGLSTLLFVGCLIGTPAASSVAGVTVTLTFTGNGTGASAGSTFNGAFDYSTKLTDPTDSGTFNFTPLTIAAYAHSAHVTTSTGISDSYVQFQTFKITTAGTQFNLDTNLTSTTPATEMKINLTLLSSTDGMDLPVCTAFPTSNIVGSITLIQGGVTKYTGSFTTLSCSPPGLTNRIPPPPQPPSPPCPVPPVYYPAPYVVVPCSPTYTMVACPPPRRGCFANLFSCRRGVWCR